MRIGQLTGDNLGSDVAARFLVGVTSWAVGGVGGGSVYGDESLTRGGGVVGGVMCGMPKGVASQYGLGPSSSSSVAKGPCSRSVSPPFGGHDQYLQSGRLEGTELEELGTRSAWGSIRRSPCSVLMGERGSRIGEGGRLATVRTEGSMHEPMLDVDVVGDMLVLVTRRGE